MSPVVALLSRPPTYDAAAAEALLAADPAAIDGTVRYEILPWLSQ